MLWVSLIDDGSAGQLVRKLLTRAVTLSVEVRETTTALAHTAEGIITPLAREEAPKDTGALAADLRVQATPIPDGIMLALVSSLPYTPFVVHGTGIYATPTSHQAWDVEGPLQAFQVGGETVFARHTHHLGQHPDDFPGRALERAQPFLDVAVDAAGAKLLTVFWA